MITQTSALDRFALWEYRALVVENAGLSDGWRNTSWVGRAACADQSPTAELCALCPVVDECLAAALVTDNAAPLRAGLTVDERRSWFADLDEVARALDPWLAERRVQLQVGVLNDA